MPTMVNIPIFSRSRVICTYLNGAEDPENESLNDCQERRSDAKGKINSDEHANVLVLAALLVGLGPFLEPYGAT